jgi:hypothetical protein
MANTLQGNGHPGNHDTDNNPHPVSRSQPEQSDKHSGHEKWHADYMYCYVAPVLMNTGIFPEAVH